MNLALSKDNSVVALNAYDGAQAGLGRPNGMVVDAAAIRHNVGELRRLIGNERVLFGTLKADAYGFGLIEAARIVLTAGCDGVAVADLSDAVALRKAGIDDSILVFAGSAIGELQVRAVEHHRLIATIYDQESFDAYCRHVNTALDVAIKVDVGMDRLGLAAEDSLALVRAVWDHPKLRLRTLTTHLHTPDLDTSVDYMEWQFARFGALLEGLKAAGIAVPLAMAASSSPIQAGMDVLLDAVDPGSLLFGMRAPGPQLVPLDLRPAFTRLTSMVIHIKDVERQDFQAAGVAGAARKRVAVLPIGEYDGIHQFHAGYVLIGGAPCPILGKATLEYLRVDVSNVPGVRVGDEAVFLGEQAACSISLREVLEYQGLREDENYPLILRGSIPRYYTGHSNGVRVTLPAKSRHDEATAPRNGDVRPIPADDAPGTTAQHR